jgi:hypothetical protein
VTVLAKHIVHSAGLRNLDVTGCQLDEGGRGLAQVVAENTKLETLRYDPTADFTPPTPTSVTG